MALGPLALLVLVVALYLPSAGFDFIYDDATLIENEPAPRSPADVARVFGERHWHNLPYYRPVARVSMVVQKALHGNRPAPFHLFNVATIGLAALLVHALLTAPPLRIGRGPAWIGAALFALHPIASVTVYPICSGRESLLPVLFSVAALAAWLRPGRGWTLAAQAAFAAALFSKESAIVVPALFVLADTLGLSGDPPGRDPGRWTRRYLPAGGILLGYMVTRWWIFAGTGEHHLALFERPLGPLLTLLYTAQTTLAPFVELVYEPPVDVWLSPARQIVAWVLIGLAVFACRRHGTGLRPQITLWLGWIVLAMIPTGNVLVQEARFAERYGLPALVGCVGIVALLLSVVAKRASRVVAGAVFAVLVLLAAISVHRGGYFRDDAAFHGQWLHTDPASPNAHNGLGVALAQEGRFVEAAERHAEAVRLKDDHEFAWNNWGLALERTGDLPGAVERYERALSIDPDYAEAHYNLANLWVRLERPVEAEKHYTRALELRPDYVKAHNNYAALLLRLDRTAEAMSRLAQVMRLDADHARSRVNYGILLVRQGRVEQAIPYYREALRIDPDYPDAHFDLAVALQQIGEETEARRSYRTALELARRAGRVDLVTLIEQRLGPGS
jgi:tetratricopeptide (TPR) repeat protein